MGTKILFDIFLNSMINIALNTFREIVRNKFLYLILVFAAVFILFSLSMWAISLWNDDKVIVDFGLAMIEVFGLIGVLFVGSQLLFNEIEGKTIFLILSKPIKRSDFILWKFLWFSITIGLIIFVQSLLFLFMLMIKGIDIQGLILFSLLFSFVKLEILLSIVIFFSTFMSNMLTIVVSLLVYFISHSFSLVIDMMVRAKSVAWVYFAQGVSLLFPPLEAINIKEVIGSFQDFSSFYLFSNLLYSVCYIVVIMLLSIVIFNRKKFEW